MMNMARMRGAPCRGRVATSCSRLAPAPINSSSSSSSISLTTNPTLNEILSKYTPGNACSSISGKGMESRFYTTTSRAYCNAPSSSTEVKGVDEEFFAAQGNAFWSSVENVKDFLSFFTQKRGIHAAEDWYTVKAEEVRKAGGERLLLLASITDLAIVSFPDFEFLPWRFDRLPYFYWKKKENQRRYLDWLGARLGFVSREDWYRVRLSDFNENFGGGLITKYFNGSPSALIISAFNDFEFLPWLFNVAPIGFFDSAKNRKSYLDWLKAKEGLRDFSELQRNHFLNNKGGDLLNKYNGSPQLVVKSVLDSNSEDSSASSYTLKGAWSSLENHKKYLEDLASKLGFDPTDQEKWYTVSTRDVVVNGGGGLLRLYDNSLYALLVAVYPSSEWRPWRFAHTPKNSWKDPTIMTQVIKYVEKELKMKNGSDWNRVTISQLKELGVDNLFVQNGGVGETIEKFK